jgi:hypothetical protein
MADNGINEDSFAVGDRVRCAPFGQDLPRFGTIIRVYFSTPSCFGGGHPFYEVRWDDTPEETRSGYMNNGLQKLEEDE